MANFLNFIDEDIKAKKTLLSTMPTRTKTNVKKFNEKIDSILEVYIDYKASVKQYLIAKSRSFNIKNVDSDVDTLTKTVNDLEQVRLLINPVNTFFEKMGFDSLLFDISNYSSFNFNSMNEVINQFIMKFETAGIMLSREDFDYTCYVREYMTSFLEVRNIKTENYDALSKIFEKIYWENPEIIQHIELNFRKLIKKHKRKFITYIDNLKKEVMWKNNITNYKDCLEKLKVAYAELSAAQKENVSDIIELSKTGEIEIANFSKDSRVRTSNYSAMMIEEIDLDNQDAADRFHKGLEKLKENVKEYNSFIKFTPLFVDFKNEYENKIPSFDKKSSKGRGSKIKDIESQISDKESKLARLNKKIFTGNLGFFQSKSNVPVRQLKLDSIILAKKLYILYKEYDVEVFNEKILSILNNFLTIPELLHLYFSYDYFKKKIIKRVFNLTSYDEVISYSEEFDVFAKNPNNIIVNGVSVFEENNIARIILNKYRLDNINLTEESLDPNDLDTLIEKIQFILRVNEVEKSKTTVEKIRFMTKVDNIIKAEDKKK